MLRLKPLVLNEVLPDAVDRQRLAARQAVARTLAPNDGTIPSKWDSFVAGTGRNKGIGPAIVAAAKANAWGKCAYCEAGAATTIDHFWPKGEHPGRLFDPDNLLGACRDCQAGKLADFPIEQGEAVLVHPVEDEPLDYLRWDGVSGRALPLPGNRRASESVRIYDLDRALLPAERKSKLHRVRALLVVCARGAPVPADAIDQLRDEFDKERPCLGVVREFLLYPRGHQERVLLRAAIRAVPDILSWVRPWLRPPPGVAWPV